MNKSLICVDMKSPGITLAKRIDKLGMRSSDTAVGNCPKQMLT